MKKVILIPDSFKGTFSAKEIRALMRSYVLRLWPSCEVIEVPLSDGGEGFTEAFLQASGGGVTERFEVQGPLGDAVRAEVGFSGRTAFVETASCAGLNLIERTEVRSTLRAKARCTLAGTFGVGQLIKVALDKGCEHILAGLGGSATTDGGCGTAAALGVKFFDGAGRDFVPVGGTLNQIAHIDLSGVDERLKRAKITGICDVRNPLYGPQGSAFVFAPQKGASEQEVEVLDAGLRHLAGIVKRDLGLDWAEEPGAGAAGGLGFGLMCFTGARLQSGIETLLDLCRFDEMLQGCDCVFTGEGRLDSQSLMGKAVGGIARRCLNAGVRLTAVVGSVQETAREELAAAGITDIILLRDFNAVI